MKLEGGFMREEKVIKYYVLCNKLKDVIRTGWKNWNIKRERIESVAEHIYGVQMLALAIKSEYQYDVDIMKVINMLAVHELEEILIGDISTYDPRHKNKREIGVKAVRQVVGNLLDKETIIGLVDEFDERITKEAKFAYHCDKLECDLQAKLYDEEGVISLDNQSDNPQYNSFETKKLLNDGAKTFADLWFLYDKHLFDDDCNFQSIFNFAKEHKITLLDGEINE